MNPNDFNNGFPNDSQNGFPGGYQGGFPGDAQNGFPGGYQGGFPGEPQGGSYHGHFDTDFGRTNADPVDMYRVKRDLGYHTEEYNYARASRQKGIGIKLAVIGTIIMMIGLLGMGYVWLQTSGMQKVKDESVEAEVTITLVQQYYSYMLDQQSADSDSIFVSYTYDNKSYTNISAGVVKHGRYQSGEKMSVLINKKNPGVVTIDTSDKIKSEQNIFMSVFAVGFIVIVIHFLVKKTKKGMSQNV